MLVVDDAVVVRRIVSDVLSESSEIEVVGTAPNGRLALAKIPTLDPDVVTLDIEMPEMDGLATLTELRKSRPQLPVIMFSTLTERGAQATLDALALGASDYVTKPAQARSAALAQEFIREALIPRILGLGRRWSRTSAPPPVPLPAPRKTLPSRADLVAIGVSTGGPNALAEVVRALPADFPVPIVVVQHMPPVFTRFLADRLASISGLAVREGADGSVVRPGTVWIAPGNFHMTLQRVEGEVRLALDQNPPENSCRPAVDPLFRSVAQVFGRHSMALILTGMGHDGLEGAQEIQRAGGQVLAQDEESSVVWGMPGAIVSAGLAEKVLPLGEVAAELVQRTQVGRLPGHPGRPATPSVVR